MIKIDENLVIVADGHCYAVGKPVQKQSGEIFIQKPKYYSTMAQTLRGCVSIALRNGVADGSITTLRQFMDEQQRLTDQIKVLLTPLEV